ncbi:MAG: carboxypeptidase regulatory-like domain-containing protein, partial [Blastocatellia bacterium]|nr:carboxypeptidase regulatory-like domain-containing protein [Blastocatellia bacterium]
MNNRSAQIKAFLAFIAILLIAHIPALSQQVTAAILGRVADQTDAPIAKAKVSAKDEERGTLWTTETNSEGVFNLPRLPVGKYEIRVEVQGFRTAVRPDVLLEINQTARIDFKMVVGEITQTAEITGALPPLLQTETTQLGTVIDSRTNVTLPLASRNYIQLTLLAPGSIHPDPSTLTGPNPSTTIGTPPAPNSGRPYINGNREQANNFILDGLDNNQVSDNLVAYTPSPDAIQEFNLITSNASAEFGNFQGGIVSVTVKSGTNEIHGSAFEFLRNDVLNANSWSNNFSGLDKPKQRWNLFGGSIGGPIIKDKLFFFADYQGLRNIYPQPQPITVFTNDQRQGNFSAICSQYDPSGVCLPGSGTQLYNPFQLDAGGNRVPFAFNQIPANLIDPVAKALLNNMSLYPAPINDASQNNQTNLLRTSTSNDQGDLKIDYNISLKDHIFGRYSQSRQDTIGDNSFPVLFNTFFLSPTRNGVVDWTRTFSP